jgi:hypothetical protein
MNMPMPRVWAVLDTAWCYFYFTSRIRSMGGSLNVFSRTAKGKTPVAGGWHVGRRSIPVDFSLLSGIYYVLALAVNNNLNDLVTLDDAFTSLGARVRGSNNTLFEFEDLDDFDFNDMVLTINQLDEPTLI